MRLRIECRPRLAQLVPRALEGERLQRVIEGQPLLVATLRRRAFRLRADQEVLHADGFLAGLEFEPRADRSGNVAGHTRFLEGLAHGRRRRRLTPLDMPLGNTPGGGMLPRSNQRDGEAMAFFPKDDPARLRTAPG